jgi:hypothetical protein
MFEHLNKTAVQEVFFKYQNPSPRHTENNDESNTKCVTEVSTQYQM